MVAPAGTAPRPRAVNMEAGSLPMAGAGLTGLMVEGRGEQTAKPYAGQRGQSDKRGPRLLEGLGSPKLDCDLSSNQDQETDFS